MEGVYNRSGSKAPKLKSLAGNVSPLNVPVFGHGGGRYHPLPNNPILDPYASSDSSKSPLLRYLLSSSPSVKGRSPLASIENIMDVTPPRSPAVFKAPVNVEEDVLVMDGISVNPKQTASRTRSSSCSSNSGCKSSTGSSFSVSGGGGGRWKETAKVDTCVFWKESDSCRFGANCLFQHGNEVLSQNSTPRLQRKKKAEISKAYSAGSCTSGPKCKPVHRQVNSSTLPASPQALSPLEINLPNTPEIVCPEVFIKPASISSNTTTSTHTLAFDDWSPLDDGIEVDLPCPDSTENWSPLDDGIEVDLPCPDSTENKSSRDDVISYIQGILHGPARGRRLPVFAEICGE